MSAPDLDAWEPWRPFEAARRLEGIGVPWMVAGGWALDLWHGRETRPHGDLEIAIPRVRFDEVRRRLAGLRLYVAGDGRVRPLEGEPPPEDHQVWVLDEAAGAWRMDVFLEPGDDATWVCRRDEAGLRLPRDSVVAFTPEGIPYLRPEFVLLFKAKAAREKDEADFARALSALAPEARAWLRSALERIHPRHGWIDRL